MVLHCRRQVVGPEEDLLFEFFSDRDQRLDVQPAGVVGAVEGIEDVVADAS